MNSDTSRSGGALDRRTFLKGAAGVAGAAAVGAGAAAPTAAQSGGELSSWFDGVSNYEGVVDETGKSEVTVEVGAAGNNGNFAFGPAAVRVDPGTTIVWEWTGKGGSHDVAAEDGSFGSQMTGSEGHTFEQTFSEKGIVKYACTPHKAMGMKGAVVVGSDAAASAPTSSGSSSAESTSSGSGEAGGSSVQSGFGSWFDGVSNYEGVVDGTGRSEVTITVGAAGNNGNFAFGPAAVRVDPGTTVVWEWNGKGGSHDVVAEDGSFQSESSGSAGHTFEQTFDEPGITKYACTPHEAMGMKGAVVVGSEAAADEPTAGSLAGGGSGGSDGSDLADTLTVGLGGALVAGLLGLPAAEMRKRRKESQ